MKRNHTLVALIVMGLALAVSAQARSGKGHHGGEGHGGWIERHAEDLGIDDATRAEIDRLGEASREQGEAIRAEHRAARDAMRELLAQDEPDRDAVMRQAEVIGEIDVRKQKHKLATELEIRALLTPEQRSQLSALKDEMRDRHDRHRKGGRHGRHHGDRDRPGADPQAGEL